MARTEYEIVWKKGGWFEKGHFALIPKKSLSDKAGEALVMYIFILVILLLILSMVAVTSPIWIVIIGYQMVREKRYYAGLASLLAIGYFYIDINERWLTSFLFLGYNNSTGEFVEGLFGLKYLHYLEVVNLVAGGLGIGYMIDGILVSKYGKKFDDNRITTPQALIYIAPMLLALLLSKSMKFEINNEQSNVNEVVSVSKADEVALPLSTDTFSIANDIDSSYNSYSEEKTSIMGENDLPRVSSQYELLDLVYEGKPNTWYILDKKTNNYGMVDKQGKIILPVEFSEKFDFNRISFTEKVYAVGVKNGKYGILDIDNNVIVDFKYNDYDISSTLGYVCLQNENRKWGLVDMNLNIEENLLIDFNYDALKPIYAGRKCDGIIALKNNLWGYIDLNENVIIEFKHTSSDSVFDEVRKL